MLNKRLGAAQKVAAELFALEAAIDAALEKAGALQAAMPAARAAAGVSALYGQDAMASGAKLISSLVEARAAMCETHEHLGATSRHLGLGERMSAGMPKPAPPAHGRLDHADTPLRVVEAA